MLKYSFKNDYSEGTHETILEALNEKNCGQQEGYGQDDYCRQAATLLRAKIQNPQAEIHFLSGGTQTNLTALSSMLRPYESIIAAESSHIATHETGAIEACGHKINTLKTCDGKLQVRDIQKVLETHGDEHMVKPKVVFVSNSTEVGSIYLEKELQELFEFCKHNALYLYLDGARLGSALTSAQNDLDLPRLAELTDMFYIGGTKNGALLGEALVILHPKLKTNFRFYMKQKGALLAKGSILGIQFLQLFKDNLFFRLAEHANLMARKLAQGIERQNFSFLLPPLSNQIFPILPNQLIKKLKPKYGFYVWEKIDTQNSAIRLVTSWATKEEAVQQFIDDLR